MTNNFVNISQDQAIAYNIRQTNQQIPDGKEKIPLKQDQYPQKNEIFHFDQKGLQN